MNNSNRFFGLAQSYQDKRHEALQAYRNRMQDIASTKGSKFYDKEATLARDTLENSLKTLREDAYPRLMNVIDDMAMSNHDRPMTAPTDEQARIISMLKMKETVTRDDLTAAARACKDCPVALSILDELAQQKEILGFAAIAHAGAGAVLSVSAVSSMLSTLREGTKDFLDSASPRGARLSYEYTARNYGAVTDVLDLPEREPFRDDLSMYRTMGMGAMDQDTLTAFLDAVNGC